jgi:hypothetical protein
MTVLVGEVWVAMRPEMAGFTKEVESKLERLSNPSGATGIGGIMNKVGTATSAGLAIAVAGSIKLAMDMQQSQAQLQGTMGLTAKAAANIGNAFLGTAGKSTYSGNEMMKAFAPVGGQLKIIEGHALTAAQSLSFMDAAAKLADATNHDLTGNTAALARTLQAFQLKTKDAAGAANTLFTTSRSTGVSVDSLSSTLGRLHMKLGDLNPSLTGVSSLMVDLAQRSVVGSRGILAVSSGLEHLIVTATKSGPALEKSITSASKSAATAGTALATAQTRLAQKQADLASTGGATTVSQKNALANAQAAVTKAMEKSTTAQQALTSAQQGGSLLSSSAASTLSSLNIQLFNSQGKFIGMRNLISQLQPKLSGLTGGARQLALANLFGAGSAQLMNKVIEAGPKAFDKATAAVMKHNAVSNAASAYQNTLKGQLETLRATVTDLATRFGRVLIPVMTDVVKGLSSMVKWLQKNKVVAEILGGVIATILAASMLHFIASTSKKFIEAIAKDITGILSLGKGAQTTAGRVTLASGEYTDSLGRMHAANGRFIASTPELEAAFAEAGAGAEESATGFSIAGAAMDAIPIFALIAATTLLATHWKQVWTVVKLEAVMAWHFLENDVIHPITKAFDATINFIKSHWKQLLPILVGPFAPFLYVFLNFHKQIQKGLNDVANWFENLPKRILHALAGAGKWLLGIGKDIIMGLVHGMEKGFDVVRHTIAHIASNVLNFFKSGFGIFSPSRPMMDMGGKLMEGLAAGVTNNKHLASKAISGINLNVPNISTSSSSGNATSRQMLIAMQQLVTETRSNTAALSAQTAQDKKPLKATVNCPTGSSSNSDKKLALSVAR